MRTLVRDVMSIRIIAVQTDTSIQEVIRLLLRARIGGVPVVDDERLVGIVSESDLQPLPEERPRSPRVAADVMTAPVVTLTEEDSVPEAARVLRRHRIKRAPVVREGRVVGIVTQSDLLRPYLRTDAEIRADVEEALLHGDVDPRGIDIRVAEGVVTLEGAVGDARRRRLLTMLARSIDGVIDVVDALDPAASNGDMARRSPLERAVRPS